MQVPRNLLQPFTLEKCKQIKISELVVYNCLCLVININVKSYRIILLLIFGQVASSHEICFWLNFILTIGLAKVRNNILDLVQAA